MIETRNLTKRYGTLTALDGLTLDIGPGQVFGFIGPNGAGKSTTMKILACLMRADAGSASVCGLDVSRHGDDIRRVIGYMPDFLGVYDDLTVDEYLQFFASAFAIPRAKRRSVVDQVLQLTDLTEKRHALVDSLSRGMQQRLGVARVLIHDPKVLLLDEPASGLDPRARIEMRELLLELGRMGKVLMVSSHILSELAEMCTSIGIIERGKLLYAGTIEDAYQRTKALAGGGESIKVLLEEGSAPPELLIPAISRHSLVTNASAEGPLALTIRTTGHPGHNDLIRTLIDAGARINSFQPMEIKLEDAFLRLTTGALQ
ncbi:MAG: ABC transporter ATP-binding protein [Planctomycetes bacterium]|nr:ABC transporter ATP-binding protein [Planctomycetota bacterium]